MALFMDIHYRIEGLTADALKHAHEADLAVQQKYGCRYLQYWFDERHGRVICLIDAPNAEAATMVHREAHGLEADEIFEVQQGIPDAANELVGYCVSGVDGCVASPMPGVIT